MDHQNRWFICEECIFVFQTHSKKVTNKNYYCPSCGENKFVIPYKAVRNNEKRTHIMWTTDEIKTALRMKSKGMLPHQIALNLGRPTGSVREKLRRLASGTSTNHKG